MNLTSRFTKDYINYLVSIILPALVSGLSIPVLKRLLGPQGYGEFSIWFNAILLINAVLSGWIAQSIIRFSPASKNVYQFSKHAFILAIITVLIASFPVFFSVWYLSQDFILAVLCVLALSACILQFTILPIAQSSFLSKKIIVSEIIRVFSYMGIAILLLTLSGMYFLYALFLAVVISYLASVFFLIKSVFKRHVEVNNFEESSLKGVFKIFFKYGAPLSLWFVFTYLITYIDKLFLLSGLGSSIQGNYQALFDLLSKSIVIIFSPVLTSVFPIVTASYEKGDRKEIKLLLKRIIIIEFVAMIVIGILYWFIGANIMSLILHIPHTTEYKWIGIIMIASTFILQIGALIQKKHELKLKSLFLAVMMFIAFLTQLIVYFIFRDSTSILLYPLGVLTACIVYVLLISFSEIASFFSSLTKKRSI